MATIAASLPSGMRPIVQDLGWIYLFRVQKTTKFISVQGQVHQLGDLVKMGEYWRGQGVVFKRRGRRWSYAEVYWAPGYAEPWCLVTNRLRPTSQLYAIRYWQEASFRDLKSDGWQWQVSRVWPPDHAERLILVMALAYAITLCAGTTTPLPLRWPSFDLLPSLFH